ncbi:hypothetical protein B4Q13_14895 [Lacticaseibacillus rhamnosus]
MLFHLIEAARFEQDDGIVVRYRAAANPVPSKVHHNTLLEVAWVCGLAFEASVGFVFDHVGDGDQRQVVIVGDVLQCEWLSTRLHDKVTREAVHQGIDLPVQFVTLTDLTS